MELADYFESVSGIGILATADADGRPNVALYARPHVMTDGTVVFLMADKKSHANIAENPHAAYIFVETGAAGYHGKRLYLTKVAEKQDSPRADELRRHDHHEPSHSRGVSTFLVTFRLDSVAPLTGPPRDDKD